MAINEELVVNRKMKRRLAKLSGVQTMCLEARVPCIVDHFFYLLSFLILLQLSSEYPPFTTNNISTFFVCVIIICTLPLPFSDMLT